MNHCTKCGAELRDRSNFCDCRKGESMYLPDADVIRAECEAIQATWTDYERERRKTVRNREWTPPVIGMPYMEAGPS